MSGNASIPGPSGTPINFTVSGATAQAIAQVFSSELASLTAANIQKVTVPAEVTTPGAGTNLLIINDSTGAGDQYFIPSTVEFVFNESVVPIEIIPAPGSSTQIITPTQFVGDAAPVGATTVFGTSGGGSDVSGAGNNLFQALGTGGGQYFVSFGAGNDTIWATSGDNVLDAGAGSNLIGLGSGNNFVTSGGADTILAGSGNNTIVASTGSSDLIFGSTGSLLFIGGAGTSTVISGAGNETLFGGTGSGLYFTGSGPFLYSNQGGNDTVVAGPGAASVALFGGSGGTVNLFSAASNNLLVADGGNETLNAAGATGNVNIWAGTGNDSLVGGAGSDVFAFVHGAAGGADTITGWTPRDTLALLGYSASGGFNQSTVNGNATITLSDGTRITVAGVANIPGSHIFLS